MDKEFLDTDLVKRALTGDSDAFAILVRRYQDVAYAAAYAVVHNFHDAQDIAQDAWIRAYKKLTTYDQTRPFGAWLYRISKRRAIDWWQSMQHPPTTDISAASTVADPRPQPDEEQEIREMCDIVHRALATLSEVNRETTTLYYINGYSQEEVSRFLSVPLGTVKRRLHESRKFLMKEVMQMVKETFKQNKLTWQFTQDVVERVSQLKKDLTDYLPAEFHELAQMSKEELKERWNRLLRSLTEVLSVSPEAVTMEEEITFNVADLSEEQREYLYQTLHELELMEIVDVIRNHSRWMILIQDFASVKVGVGHYNWPSNDKIHNKPYVRLYRPNPDGSAHSMQMGLIEEAQTCS